MSRFRIEKEEEDGWTRWVMPVMQGYRMACCDCGLVHSMEFRALKVAADDSVTELDTEEYRVEFRVKRNNRSTAQVRRHMNDA